MATDHNFRIKNGLTVGAVEVIDSSGKLTANAFGTNSNEKIEDVVADMITGSTHSNITVTYNDTNGTLAFSAAAQYGDSDVESYLDGGTSTPSFASQSTGLITSNIASNGILHDLQIGSSSKGKIRIVDGDVVIHSTPSGHTGIRLGNGYLAITNNAGAISNGSYDLGLNSYKFKDGYFSGTVNAGTISSGAITSSGYISAGETSGTSGGLVLASRYSGDDHIATISSMYSNGGWVLGYGAKAKNGASGFVSTFDNFSGARSYLRIQNSAIAIGYAPNQQTAVDSDLTSVSEPFVFTPSSGALSITGQLTASTVNTGQGATEVHLMNQNLRTSDSPTFGTITATSLNTGHGNNELYAMNQNVRTTDAVTFSTVNTGQGAHELYAMNQNVRTTDNVIFNRVTVDPASGGANFSLDRSSTSVHNNLLFYTGSTLYWRLWQSGANNSIAIRNEVTTTNVLTFTDNESTFSHNINAPSLNTGHGDNELYAMNQNVRSSDSPTFVDLTVTGNLNITGDINSYNVTDLDVTDKTITVGSGQTEANSGGSGLIVDGSGASLLWDEADNYWAMNKKLAFDSTPTTTNQGLGIVWTGFDKEGTTDFSDSASIVHTTNTGGHGGSVLLISSANDSGDGIAFSTHGSSYLKHNSSEIITAGNYSTFVTSVASATNADTVDSLHASSFLRSDANDTATGLLTFNGVVDLNNTVNFDASGQQITLDTDGARRIFDFTRNGALRMSLNALSSQDGFNFDFTSGSNLQINGNRILTTSDEGSYLKSDAADTATGALTFQGSFLSKGHSSGDNWMPYTDGNFYFRAPNVYFDNNVKFQDGSGSLELTGDSSSNYYMAASGDIRIRPSGTTVNKIIMTSSNLEAPAFTAGGNTVWHAGNDGSGSGLHADLLDGFERVHFTNAEDAKLWTGIYASATQAKRYHIARLYGCPAHWDSNWQNIEFIVTAESYESAFLKFRLMGDYGGAGSQANMIKVYLQDAQGPLVNNFRFVLGSPVDAGWDHSGQDTFYVDLYAEARHYAQYEIHAKTYGHATQSSNPTSGGATTVFYSSPTVTNISDFSVNHIDPTFRGYKIWHAGNDGANSTLDADKLDGQEGSYYLNYNNFSNTPTIPSAVTNNNQLTNGAGYTTYTANQALNTSSTATFANLNTANTGYVGIGDDVRLKDVSVGNTFGVVGQQNNDRGFISFGSSTTALGRIGTGQLTWGGDEIYHEGHKPTYAELGTMAYSNLTGTPTIPTNNNQLTNGAGYTTNVGDVTSVTADAPLSVSNGGGPNPHIVFSSPSVTTSTSNADGDFFLVHSGTTSSGNLKKLTKANINISGFNNDSGYTTYTANQALNTSSTPTFDGLITNDDITFNNSGTTKRGIRGTMGDNDMWFIGGGATASNSGYMEIATGDDGQTSGSAEQMYFSQYGPGSPWSGTLYRRHAMFDGNGQTIWNVQRTPTSVTSILSDASIVINTRSGSHNYIQLRNDSDDGTHAGLVFTDNNHGGSVLFTNHSTTENTANRADTLHLSGYQGVDIRSGTGDASVPANKTRVARFATAAITLDKPTSVSGALSCTGNLTCSTSNTTGGGIILADDGDIVDLNDAYCSMRFSYGVRIFSGNRSGSAVIALKNNGEIIANSNITAYGSASDERLKENIETIKDPIKKVQQLRGVTFDYKKDGSKSTGLIAQELEKVLPEVVYETVDADNDDNKYKAVRYGNTVGLLVEAIKEQQEQIEELKQIINTLVESK